MLSFDKYEIIIEFERTYHISLQHQFLVFHSAAAK